MELILVEAKLVLGIVEIKYITHFSIFFSSIHENTANSMVQTIAR